MRISPLPPLPSLIAFEAAMRHGSFTRAAAELHLTQSAISRQIAQLERFLGKKLFLREPQVQARHDLKRFKMLMETGEIATSARTRDETRAAKQENG